MIYIVVETGGEYEDWYSTNLKAFGDETKAQQYCNYLHNTLQSRIAQAEIVQDHYGEFLKANSCPSLYNFKIRGCKSGEYQEDDIDKITRDHTVLLQVHNDLWDVQYQQLAVQLGFNPVAVDNYERFGQGPNADAAYHVESLEFEQ